MRVFYTTVIPKIYHLLETGQKKQSLRGKRDTQKTYYTLAGSHASNSVLVYFGFNCLLLFGILTIQTDIEI